MLRSSSMVSEYAGGVLHIIGHFIHLIFNSLEIESEARGIEIHNIFTPFIGRISIEKCFQIKGDATARPEARRASSRLSISSCT